jgi:ribosomal protein S14
MLSKIIKDKKFRNSFYNIELKYLQLKYLQLNYIQKILHNKLSKKTFSTLQYWFSSRKRVNCSKVKIVRRCIITGRSRSSLRQFKISRIYLRESLSLGRMPGYIKSIW